MSISLTEREKRQNNLCEELLRERACVLARAGQAVEDALDKLVIIERDICTRLCHYQKGNQKRSGMSKNDPDRDIIGEINTIIEKFNELQKKAKLQYYYLIVTREAMGLRRHDCVEEIYRIPPQKKTYRRLNG